MEFRMNIAPLRSDEPTEDQVVEQVYRYAAQQLNAGVAPSQVIQELVAGGLTKEDAAAVVRQMRQAQSKEKQEAGRKNMLYGALWCIGGLAVTFFSYQSATTGGGKYVIAWGAVIFGAIQFFQGLGQSISE